MKKTILFLFVILMIQFLFTPVPVFAQGYKYHKTISDIYIEVIGQPNTVELVRIFQLFPPSTKWHFQKISKKMSATLFVSKTESNLYIVYKVYKNGQEVVVKGNLKIFSQDIKACGIIGIKKIFDSRDKIYCIPEK